jgi:hypothetical protein
MFPSLAQDALHPVVATADSHFTVHCSYIIIIIIVIAITST